MTSHIYLNYLFLVKITLILSLLFDKIYGCFYLCVLQEPLSPFLRGASFSPGNNVIYEKTIRKYELLNPLQVSWVFMLSIARRKLSW